MTLPLPEAPRSMWAETYGPYTPDPPLSGDQRADVAIIGGGFTGLMTAYELKRADPGLDVVVLEARDVGFGSSGRNGSFAMTVVGLGFQYTKLIKGEEYLIRSHRYMMRAVDTLWELAQREELDAEVIRPGFLRVATSGAYEKKIRGEVQLMNRLGFDDIHYLDARETRARVDSPLHLGAMWEPRFLLVHPMKLVRAEKELAQREGAVVYENSPVTRVEHDAQIRLLTPNGSVTADKVVFATNAYSHFFPALKRKQVPAFTYATCTEPLGSEAFEAIGWDGFEGVEDARNRIHYYRRTMDDRIMIGAGPIGFTWANDMNKDTWDVAYDELQSHFRATFPHLRDAKFSHEWGGPFSVTLDLNPAIGYAGDQRAVYSLGCIGHGVSMTHLNAQTIRDLILERKTDLTESPFVNRTVIPWPPEPIRSVLGHAARTYLRIEDWAKEGEVRRKKAEAEARAR